PLPQSGLAAAVRLGRVGFAGPDRYGDFEVADADLADLAQAAGPDPVAGLLAAPVGHSARGRFVDFVAPNPAVVADPPARAVARSYSLGLGPVARVGLAGLFWLVALVAPVFALDQKFRRFVFLGTNYPVDPPLPVGRMGALPDAVVLRSWQTRHFLVGPVAAG